MPANESYTNKIREARANSAARALVAGMHRGACQLPARTHIKKMLAVKSTTVPPSRHTSQVAGQKVKSRTHPSYAAWLQAGQARTSGVEATGWLFGDGRSINTGVELTPARSGTRFKQGFSAQVRPPGAPSKQALQVWGQGRCRPRCPRRPHRVWASPPPQLPPRMMPSPCLPVPLSRAPWQAGKTPAQLRPLSP